MNIKQPIYLFFLFTIVTLNLFSQIPDQKPPESINLTTIFTLNAETTGILQVTKKGNPAIEISFPNQKTQVYIQDLRKDITVYMDSIDITNSIDQNCIFVDAGYHEFIFESPKFLKYSIKTTILNSTKKTLTPEYISNPIVDKSIGNGLLISGSFIEAIGIGLSSILIISSHTAAESQPPLSKEGNDLLNNLFLIPFGTLNFVQLAVGLGLISGGIAKHTTASKNIKRLHEIAISSVNECGDTILIEYSDGKN